MKIKTVELKTPLDFRIHGNLSRSPLNQLLAKHGRFSNLRFWPEQKTGTIRDAKGKDWDWWINDDGDVVTTPAK